MALRFLSMFVLAFASVAGSVLAQVPAERPPASTGAEVLVLGVYHMSNPGRDIFNMQADDVLAPKRQAEMTQLIEILMKFRPTKIAVEREIGDDRIAKDYSSYLAGTHDLTRNEIEQIGFRLAKDLGHKTVYPVDTDGEFPYQRLVNYATASGRSQELDAIMGGVGAAVKEQGQHLASHTILETLRYMNANDKVAQDVGLYGRLAHFGEPGDWAGADLVAEWFRRNMRIFTNVARLVDSPNERVLVVFGAGHLGWLRHMVDIDPTLRSRQLAEYAK